MDARVSPPLVIWPSLMGPYPLPLLLVLGWSLNFLLRAMTSLILKTDLTSFGFIFWFEVKNKEVGGGKYLEMSLSTWIRAKISLWFSNKIIFQKLQKVKK
jgi:hypothetical protein